MINIRSKRNIWPYLLILPALIIVICVVFIPVAEGFLMSLQKYDLKSPKTIGYNDFANYIKLFKDKVFWQSARRTIIWVVAGVGFQFFFGFLLALSLNTRFPGRGIARSLSLVPWVTPGIVIGLMWRWMYDGNHGVINFLLTKIGITKNFAFLADPHLALPSVIVTLVWQGIPFFVLMLLAGLQGVPEELYESASIDGAGKFQQLIHITIPSIKNSILVSVLLRIIWVTNQVDIIYSMTEGGPANLTQTIAIYIYKKTGSLDLGYSSAMAVVLMIFLTVVAIPYVIITFKNQEK